MEEGENGDCDSRRESVAAGIGEPSPPFGENPSSNKRLPFLGENSLLNKHRGEGGDTTKGKINYKTLSEWINRRVELFI